MKLEDVLNGYSKVVVFSGHDLIITWNHSLMLQAYGLVEGEYHELGISRTFMQVPETLSEVCEAAERFYWNN
jgi:hypothetical protein